MKHQGFTLSALLLAVPFAAAASSYPHAYVSHVEGELSLQRAAEPAPEPGSINLPVLSGDRIWTHPSSRAEVRLSGGSVLRLAENTKVDFVDFGVETILRVWSGSVILELAEPRENLRVDSPAGSVRPGDSGTYRIDVAGADSMSLSVTRGRAELSSSAGDVLVQSGETSAVYAGDAPDLPRPFNTASYDDFDFWSDRRGQSRSTVSRLDQRSIPYEVRSYASDLSHHGDWTVDSTYGYVWYPTVSAGWAPYRQGRWCYTTYGYTWVSYEPWGWAPYHYGRWGYGHRGWYWIPGTTWGPAWVSFAVGPFWIGWSPLGYYNRPVHAFHTYYRPHYKRGPHRGPYGAHGDDGGWNFATHDEFSRRAAHARLDPSIVRSSAGTVEVYDEGATLDRNLSPRRDGRERQASSGLERSLTGRTGLTETRFSSGSSVLREAHERAERARSAGAFTSLPTPSGRIEREPSRGSEPRLRQPTVSSSGLERRPAQRVPNVERQQIRESQPRLGQPTVSTPSGLERRPQERAPIERVPRVQNVQRDRGGVSPSRSASPPRRSLDGAPSAGSRATPVRTPRASSPDRSGSTAGASRATTSSRAGASRSRPREN